MLSRRIALFGYGQFGEVIARHLAAAGYDIYIVDGDQDALTRAAEKNFKTVQIDYTDDSELRQILVGRDIDLLFCLFSDDSENVFLVISARSLALQLRIIAVAESPVSVQKLRAAGADSIIEPYAIAGLNIARMIHRPLIAEIIDFLLFGEADLTLTECTVSANSMLVRQRLADLSHYGQYNLIILGVVAKSRGEEFLFAAEGAEHKLVPGDILLIIGPDKELADFRRAVG